MRPKRADELVGGNLYWIVRHTIVAGLPILRLEDRDDGRIDIVCAAELRTVAPKPRRAHQGWRYLEEKAAPPDLARDAEEHTSPEPEILRQLNRETHANVLSPRMPIACSRARR